MGRYALPDSLGERWKEDNREYTKEVSGYIKKPDYEVVNLNSLISPAITDVLKLRFYLMLLSYLQSPNDEKRKRVESFIEDIKKVYSKIDEQTKN